MPSVSAQVTKNNFPRLRANFPTVVSQIIRKGTMDVYAKSQITVPVRRDQRKVRGGALKNSGQVKVESSGADTVGTVGYNIHYAVYVHEGTRYMTARPFLENALQDTLPAIRAAFAQLESRMM